MRNESRKEPGAKAALLALARRQHGVFTMDDAKSTGMSSDRVYRLVRAGEWDSLLPGVFRAFPGDGWLQRVMAACRWAGARAAASHKTAAVLWDLEGVAAGMIEITTWTRRQSPRNWLAVHEVRHAVAVQRRKSVPVTTVARTLIDLGSTEPPAVVEAALQDALRRRLTTRPRLEAALAREGGRGRRGTSVLSRLVVAETSAPVESELERRVLRVLMQSGLPPPVRQHVVEDSSGFVARLDFAYPDAMLGIEADGYRWHSGRQEWSRDRTRLNELVGMGWRILHATWADLETGGRELVDAIRKMLGQQSLP